MKNDLTELVFILDRSGSMSGLEDDTIGGFNGMIEKQKKEEGRALVTTVLFDDRIETLHDRVPLEKMEKMTDRDYTVRGCTALLDAIGTTVKHISEIHRYARKEDVPAHTVFVITTDGMENASREYSVEKVKKLIEEKSAKGWEFLFLAANIDAVSTAASIGVSRERAVDYCADEAGTEALYESMNKAVRCMRKGMFDPSWSEAVKKDRARRGK
ncbi:MAG: VWA domain-containing protein [Oscillibacter sp.]|nr:VWA domain-containing protein [Oscillibacter sp.]